MSNASEARSLDERVRGVLDVPLHRFLGVALTDQTEPAAGITLPVGEAASNNAGVLHGGIVTALLDVASYLAVLATLSEGENAVTHDISASLLRPVSPGSQLHVSGTVVRRGRGIAFLRAEAVTGAVTVATGQVTKTVLSSSR